MKHSRTPSTLVKRISLIELLMEVKVSRLKYRRRMPDSVSDQETATEVLAAVGADQYLDLDIATQILESVLCE